MTAAPHSNGSIRRLKTRAQFLNVAKGTRAGRTAFALQTIAVDDAEPGVGLTVTKKTGNSPQRSRIKRRLRAAARACGLQLRPQHDYVLIARREALSEPFAKLVSDLSSAIAKVHASPRTAGPQRP